MTSATDDGRASPAADMLPPGGDHPCYSEPRGTCPHCTSGEVVHLVIGMPAEPADWGSGPEWVEWVGCVHPGYDRRCASCGQTWTDSVRSPEEFEDVAALMAHAEVSSLDDLADWISEDYDHDAWLQEDDLGLEVGFQNRSVTIEFPIGEDDLWQCLDELHDEASG